MRELTSYTSDMTGGVVFILGAGASVSTGAPIMKDFFQKSKHLRRRRRLDVYEGDFDVVNYARNILRRAKIKSRLDIDNLEEIYTALEMVEIIDGIDELTAEQAKVTQQSLNNLIAITLEQSIQFPVVQQTGDFRTIEPTKAYRKLAAEAEAIRSRNSRFPITFITFNYDIAFDFALHYEDVKFSYCFDEKNHHRSIKYFKLHGSLHWALDQNTKTLIDANLDFSDLENLGFDLHEAKHVCIRVDRGLWGEQFEHVAHFPFIVPPTGNKPYLHSLLKPIWKEAAASLRSAEIIIVIGYSFPQTDQFFRNFFALSTIGPADLEKILIVDPSEQAYKELCKIISPDLHNKIEYLQQTFDESVEEIATTLGGYLKETSVRRNLHKDWQLIGRGNAKVEGGLFVLIGVGDKTGDQVDHEIENTSMAGMLDLRDILKLIVDRLDERAFACEQLVH